MKKIYRVKVDGARRRWRDRIAKPEREAKEF